MSNASKAKLALLALVLFMTGFGAASFVFVHAVIYPEEEE